MQVVDRVYLVNVMYSDLNEYTFFVYRFVLWFHIMVKSDQHVIKFFVHLEDLLVNELWSKLIFLIRFSGEWLVVIHTSNGWVFVFDVGVKCVVSLGRRLIVDEPEERKFELDFFFSKR